MARPGQARAARWRGPGLLGLDRNVPANSSTAGDPLVRIAASGVCGTDLEILSGRIPVSEGRIMGHEGAGLVVEPRDASNVLEEGTPIVIDPVLACGKCRSCKRGLPNLCEHGGLLGRDADGLFADWTTVPARNCHLLPDTLSVNDAPALQVLATVARAQDMVSVEADQTAAVVGLGFTGQLHAQILAYRGANVLGVTRTEEKRRIASELACSWTVIPDDAVAATGESGPVDVVVECSGTIAGLTTSIDIVRPGGTILLYGVLTGTGDDLPLYDLYYKEITVLGTRASRPRDMKAAISLAANGNVRIAPLVSDRVPLDAIDDALERSKQGALKVLVSH